MKQLLILIFILYTASSSFAINVKDGDIIFHKSKSSQSKAIELATHSKYSHTGIIFYKDNTPYVLEAVQPVKYTKLTNWINHGKDSHYIVMRLIGSDSLLTQKTITNMKKEGEKFLSSGYDIYFNWSDDELYCSELVWKIFKRGADIELCKLNKLKEYDLSHKKVQSLMKKRYGNKPPLEDNMVSPQDIFDSELLFEVK